MSKLDVSVNGSLFKVEVVKSKEEQGIEEQRAFAKKITTYIGQHPALSVSFISAFLSYCGLVLLWFRFELEGIELFDYISLPDLFFGFFSVSYGPITILLILILLVFGFLSYLKEKWKTGVNGFWFILGAYLIVAPFIVGAAHLKIMKLDLVNPCYPSSVTYEVTFSPPSNRVESELYLISSLSDYKIFKRSKRGCNVSPPDGENLFDFYILAIPTSEIQTMEHKASKQIII